MLHARRDKARGALPRLAWQGWALHSSAVRREHLCFGKRTPPAWPARQSAPGSRPRRRPMSRSKRGAWWRWRGRTGEAVIPVSNSAVGTQRKSPVLKGLLKLPPACRDAASGTLWITHSPSAVQVCHFLQLRTTRKIESYIFKMITALNTKTLYRMWGKRLKQDSSGKKKTKTLL